METNEQRNARLAALFEAYAAELRAQNIDPGNYNNWLARLKLENRAVYDHQA